MKNRFTKIFTQKVEPWEQNPQDMKKKTEAPHPQASDEAGDEVAVDFQFALELATGDRKVYRDLPVTIGRGDQNDLVLTDATVSAQHARLYYDLRLRGVCISDTQSLNGVFVDDLPVSRGLLTDGARIRLGMVTMIFRQLDNPLM